MTRWKNVEAADRYRRLYVQAGLSLRQVAEVEGVSREWVRKVLAEDGLTRSGHFPGQRGEVWPDELGNILLAREVYDAASRERVWWITTYSAPAHRGVLAALGMLGPAAIPPSHLTARITREECAAALGAWDARPLSDETLSALYLAEVRATGWEPEGKEIHERVTSFKAFVAALRRGSQGDGLVAD